MNRTKIEWTDITWNPHGQGCPHNCWYCYAKRGARRNYAMYEALYQKGKRTQPPCVLCRDFIPHFHPERLKELDSVKKPCKVFVDSTADIFADVVVKQNRREWFDPVIDKIIDPKYRHITFQLLTKAPQNIPHPVVFPSNVWIGVTVTQLSELTKLSHLIDLKCGIRFVCFEPLLESMIGCPEYSSNLFERLDVFEHFMKPIEWIIVGRLTGAKKAPYNPAWVVEILEEARRLKIPIFLKNNLKWEFKVQEYPRG